MTLGDVRDLERRRLPHFLNSFILVVLSVLVGLVIGEAILRIYGITPNSKEVSTLEFDERLGWRLKKNLKYFRSSLFYGHFNYYSSEGFPTDERNFKKQLSTSTPSIAFIGDSFTESFYVPYEKSFPYLVNRKIPEKQVINLGVSGYAPDQYLLYSREILKNYNVTDIVVMFFPYNDVPDISKKIYSGKEKPFFEDSFDQPINLPLEKLETIARDENIIKKFIRNTAIYAVIRPYIRGKVILNFTPIHLPVLEPIRYDKQQMEKALGLIARIKEENKKANFLVYYIPSYEEHETQDLYQDNAELYREVCGKLSISCFTMDDVFAKIEKSSDAYITGDGHFSETGSQLVAEHLYDLLMDINNN